MNKALYGYPPPRLATYVGTQVSPLVPGAAALEAVASGSLDRLVMLASAGVAERRYALATGLVALKVGGVLTVLAPKTAGGSRLKAELEAFGCAPQETAKAHYRICMINRPATLIDIEAALAGGRPRTLADGTWTQPGVFSWDRIDPGSALLMSVLPSLAGKGADLGCGLGLLSTAVLASAKVEQLVMIDVDRRAIEAARRNVLDPRAKILWADARNTPLEGLDFVVMNPPFHEAGKADAGLGATFIDKASAALRKGGVCWMVANRQLPYEAVLAPRFSAVTLKAQTGLYKVYEARR